MKTLLIGCSGGIGSEVARYLISKGNAVIGADMVRPDGLALEAFYEVDLRDDEEVLSFCSRVIKECSKLWAIVYCAGIYPIVPFEEYTASLWDEVHQVDVRSAFVALSRLYPVITEGGRIVTIISGAAHLGSRDVGYSAAKSALMGLTKSLAVNLAPHGVLVNAICPGPIATTMIDRLPKTRVRDDLARILLKRFGTPKEVAVAVGFLLDADNSYMTGATVDVNGGLYLR